MMSNYKSIILALTVFIFWGCIISCSQINETKVVESQTTSIHPKAKAKKSCCSVKPARFAKK